MAAKETRAAKKKEQRKDARWAPSRVTRSCFEVRTIKLRGLADAGLQGVFVGPRAQIAQESKRRSADEISHASFLPMASHQFFFVPLLVSLVSSLCLPRENCADAARANHLVGVSALRQC